MNTRRGTIHLFRVAGIDLFLHWSWFLVAAIEISDRAKAYSSISWNVFEYLALFLIVTLHEFGHALACRQVGGTANRIMLWPLGGVAYVDPPARPGATLWSIAAGPLVNVALVPVLWMFIAFDRSLGWPAIMPDAHLLLRSVWYINIGLLTFQSAAHLSSRWRADSPFPALVRDGTRSQPDGKHDPGLRRRRGTHSSRAAGRVALAGSLIGIHLNVLLEGTEKRAGLVPADESSASRGLRLSVLQVSPAHWKLLGLLKLQESL